MVCVVHVIVPDFCVNYFGPEVASHDSSISRLNN